ncbi:hypothetical protein HDV00_009740 [Rhizophlyctis rosea]|nr:hypothetical protein HDV00_009740 [Rhizophlyctis rosea]
MASSHHNDVSTTTPTDYTLPPEIIREIARVAEPQTSAAIRYATLGNRALHKLISAEDVVWAEAGWRAHHHRRKQMLSWAITECHQHVLIAWLPQIKMKHRLRAFRKASWFGKERLIRSIIGMGLGDVTASARRKLLCTSLRLANYRKESKALMALIAFGAEDSNPAHHSVNKIKCRAETPRRIPALRAWVDTEPSDRLLLSARIPIALDWAVIGHPAACVKALLDSHTYHPAILNDNIQTALYDRQDSVDEILEILLGAGATLTLKQLHEAASAGYIAALKRSVEAGASVNSTLLISAARGGATKKRCGPRRQKFHFDTVKVLLNAGANVNGHDGNILLIVIHYKAPPTMVQLRLQYGANVHTRNDHPIKTAAWLGSVESVQLLLDAGADPLAKGDGPNGSALFNAATCGHVDVDLFHEYGVDIYGDNNRVLYLAAKWGQYDMVEYLLEEWMDVGEAVGVAMAGGHEEVVRLLVDFEFARREREVDDSGVGCDGGQ